MPRMVHRQMSVGTLVEPCMLMKTMLTHDLNFISDERIGIVIEARGKELKQLVVWNDGCVRICDTGALVALAEPPAHEAVQL